MRVAVAVLPRLALSLACAFGSAQAPAPSTTAASSAPTAATVAPGASAILRPSLDMVQQTITDLKLEKWKRGTVRDEAQKNTAAILRDLQTTLPPLMAAADAAPETLSNVLPMSRNVDALYDVLLRIDEASRVSAPADQITQLEQALESLRKARLRLDDHLQGIATEMEKQVTELRATVEKQAAVKCPAAAPAPVCVAPTPAHKPKKKPSTKPPATKPPASAAPGTAPASTAATPAPKSQK
jgi:hypothetical protein